MQYDQATPTDEQAVADALRGHGRGFEVLVRRYQNQVYDLALRLTGNPEEASELAQDAFLKAYERLGSLQSGAKFFSWLYALALNLGRDRLRRRGRDPVLTDQQRVERWAALAPNPEEQAAAHGDAADLVRGLGLLDPEEREMLILRYRDQTPFSQLAAMFAISQGAAKMRVRRSLDRLREMMEDKGDA